jgi:hypothetical protein
MQNYKAAHVRQPEQPVATVQHVVWSEDDLGAFWVAELLLDGRKVGGIGSYYEGVDKSRRRYSKEDQILMSSQYLCIHGQGVDCWQCGQEWAMYNYSREV